MLLQFVLVFDLMLLENQIHHNLPDYNFENLNIFIVLFLLKQKKINQIHTPIKKRW
jgi:hypothetical protein